MSIEIKAPTSSEPIVFNHLHLDKFNLKQDLSTHKKTLNMRTFLEGKDSTGKWIHNPESRFDLTIADLEEYAIWLYCKKNKCTPDVAIGKYNEYMTESSDSNLLKAMAYFQKWIAILYQTNTWIETNID